MSIKIETYQRLTTLTKTRFNTIKAAIDRLCEPDYVLSNIDVKTLQAYAIEITKKKDDFELNLQRVSVTKGDDASIWETLSEDQDSINEAYIYLSSRISILVPSENPANTSDANTAPGSNLGNVSIRLPKLDLIKFSGDLTTWTAFINLFDVTIHQNSTLSNVMKFQYLLSVLHGEPFNLVKSLSLTADNYFIAYQLLRNRYHNDRRLQSLHLNRLLDLPTIAASNPRGFRQFINEFTENSQALSALQCPVDGSNPLLAAVLLRKMDVGLRKRFEESRSKTDTDAHTFPEVKDIISFLNSECVHNEDAHSIHTFRAHEKPVANNCFKNWSTTKPVSTKRDIAMLATHPSSTSATSNNSTLSCFVCNSDSHKIYHCPILKSKPPQERYRIVKQHRHCVSCLGNHNLKQCKSLATCFHCHKPHHTLLHFGDIANSDNINHNTSKTFVASKSNVKTDILPESGKSVILTSQNKTSETNYTVLLGTLLVNLQTADGQSHVFRALLDSGSMCDIISERAANLLNASRQKSSIQLTGIDQTVTRNKGQIFASIFTVSGQLISPHHQLLILDKITVDIPRQQLSPELVHKAQSFPLADPTFHTPGHIDMVIGGSLFPQILTREQHSLGPQMPYVLGTQFGYVVMGNAPCIKTSSDKCASVASTTAICFHAISDLDLHQALQRFWQQEEPPAASKKTHEEDLCDKHFANTHTRNADGRYVLRLPFKESHPPLGTSLHAAETRLTAMENKFQRNDRFSELYHAFMDEYLDLGHMSHRKDLDLTAPHYFLPHHGILKENSSTTKLRTVFDASCKTSSGTSLNDILMTGRKLQMNICDIILQFRRYNVVFCCDIKQMYRQILIHPDDRDLQLILWRNDSSQPISTFQLNTVTYGVNSSPYLAIRTLHQLADDEGHRFPDAACVLKNHTYVDDIITGANSEQEAIQLQTQLISLLSCGGFELRKWISNSAQLLQTLPDNFLETPTFLKESQTPQFSVLGLQWSPTTDLFSYNIQFPFHAVLTKRIVLSIIAKLYDPCGFLSPFVLLTKCFMQLLWSKGCNWDEPLPSDLTVKWKQITADSQCLTDVSIPRSLRFPISGNTQLHGFCDASESGYAAVVYFRSESLNQDTTINLIIAKSKVAPLKRVTLPRLELCAAHLLAQLVAHCCHIFSGKVDPEHIYLWCDSTIVLTWLQTPSYQLKTYVANRVAQTQELVPSESWRHVSSSDNPADCASRGLLVSQLNNHPLWWQGPTWLRLPSCNWPQLNFTPVPLDSSLEIKPTPLTVLVTHPASELSVLSQFSSWTKLQRVMALVIRFINNCRSPEQRSGFITTEELRQARITIFRCVQQVTFEKEFMLISQQKECDKQLKRLNPFIDDNGLIRVGGRLKFTSLAHDAKYPILLPKTHHVTHIFIDYYHVSYLHAGPQLVQSLLTQQVWIINARSIIRSRIYKCLPCFKHRPTNHAPLMGDLPAARVIPAKPFLSTGLDYGGPFTIKMLNFRFVKHVKVYICLFICMVTKAVHIEVATDLTTESFLGCLTRFISRRGICRDIYSDCGSNLIGANAELQRIIKTTIHESNAKVQIQRFTSTQEIKFHFNPPAAPHQGGLWENAIKRAKYHLHRVLGNSVITLPEFTTLTVRIEAMLNSRPLTPLSNDPSEIGVLTPGHFLTGGPLVSIPERDFTPVPSNRLKHWQLVQKFYQHIWRRWSIEYLHTLQQRTKWNAHRDNLKVGDLVLMHSQSPPLEWPLARVTQVHPGQDGVVRVATVKTGCGSYTRPVVKLFPLPPQLD